MFNEERDYNKFSWSDLGDVVQGRPALGLMVPVLVYRLLQYTLRDVLVAELGVEKTNELLVRAGRLAGYHFGKNMLPEGLDFAGFLAELQKTLKEQKIGLLRVEKLDPELLEMELVVAEDLDCSGLPCTDEVVCQYDEGFIAGLLEAYTGRVFRAREIDCWASGDRVCRFEVRPQGDDDD